MAAATSTLNDNNSNGDHHRRRGTATGLPEWQLSATPPARVWEHGVDASFVAATIVFIVLAAFTASACVSIRFSRERAMAAKPSVDRDTIPI